MNATCKRLLSWLVVVTMVLSMVPVFDLSNFAVTTKAAENPAKGTLTAIENLRADFADKTGTVSAICPVCGGEEAVEWTPLTGAANQMAPTTENPHPHYYLSNDVTFAGQGTNFGGRNGQSICLNLNGNNITANGKALDITNGNTINVMDSAEKDGTVTGTAANFQGGAINVGNANAKFNIYGGTFKKTGTTGAVVCIRNNGGTVNMYSGTIDASDASGSACATTIHVMSGANVTTTFNLYDGLVKCGTMTAGGANYRANIMLGYGNNSGATFNMEGGTVVGGNYTGTAGNGGGTFAVVMGNTLKISGGTVYGGTSNSSGANIFSINNGAGNLEISGGTIVGEIYTRNAVNVTLSGEPQIVTSLELENGETVTATRGFDVSAAKTIDATELTGGEIQVSGVALDAVLPVNCTDAAATAAYFSHVDPTLDVGANESNQLVVIEHVEPEEPADEPEVGVFAPESCGGMAYCDACIAAGLSEEEALVEWTPIFGTGLDAITPAAEGSVNEYTHYHYYLSDNATFTTYALNVNQNYNSICLNLNGKTLTAGNQAIRISHRSTVNVMDAGGTGTVIGKSAGQSGAAIYLSSPTGEVNIYGGTFKRSTDSATSSSVVRIEKNGGKFTMYGGKIEATAISGTNAQPGIYMAAAAATDTTPARSATFDMYGGEIVGTATTGDGGAVYVTARTTFNLYKGTISGGSGRAGGNIVVYSGALNIYDGTISGGKSTNDDPSVTGGNIAVRNGGSLYMAGGVVCGGEAVQNGGNIALWYSVNTVEIVGGKIYGGVSGTSGANVYSNGTAGSELTIGGTAEIAGDIKTNRTTTNTLSGTPKIQTSGLYAADGMTPVTGTKGYEVADNTNLNVSGVTGGKIQVTGTAGVAFSDVYENAATVAQYFEATGAKQVVEANADNKLVIIENVPQVGKFEPWKYDGMAYCPVCGGEPVEWTAIDKTFVGGGVISEDHAGAHDHVYLAEDISGDVAVDGYFLDTGNNNRICLNLNGKTLNVTNGRAFGRNTSYSTWNIMDTEGGAEVTGNGVFYLNAPNGRNTFNVSGGTFKSNGKAVVEFTSYGGEFNLHGGIIDGTNCNKEVPAVTMQGSQATSGSYVGTARFTMEAGTEIKGNGELAVRVGSVLQTAGEAPNRIYLNAATFTMNGGTISNGVLQVRNDNLATIKGGNISHVTTYDGAYVEGSQDIDVEGAFDGQTRVVLEGTPEIAQMNIGENVAVNIDGLAAGAEVAISGKTGEELMNANADETVMAGITSFAPEKYVSVEDGVVYLRLNAVAVVTAGGKTYYKTVDEAITYVGAGYIELYADGLTITLEGDVYVDNRGYTVTVEGEGKLYAMDSANDDYNGCGSWTVDSEDVTVINDVINPVNGNRYIVIKNGNGTYGAHRIEMYLTHISLRTSQAGLYYKAQYKCDGTLADRVMAYGIVFSATDGEVHQDNFDDVNDVYSIMDGFKANMVENTVNGQSTSVFGIFKNDRDDNENVEAGEAKIHATPYINVDFDGEPLNDDDDYVIGNVDNDAYNANKAGVTYAAKSLYDVLVSINNNWDAYAEVQGQVKEFYKTWKDLGMSDWAGDLPNISGANA